MSVSSATAPVPLLFLIADTGGGHRASATAVRRHLEAVDPGRFDIRIVDPFAEHAPWLVARAADLYGPLVRHARWAWGAMYHATDSRAGLAALRATALRSVQPGLRSLLDTLRPAVVVTFHPLLTHVIAEMLAARPQRLPLITVITDLNSAHISWACAEADAVVTPSPMVLDRCRRAGVPAERCFDLGLPVDDRFSAPPPDEDQRRSLRRELGIPPERFTVVMVGGGDGSGGLARKARALAAAGLDVSLVVICGRNQRVRERLRGLRTPSGDSVSIHGFVDNMSDWLRAADVLVTKAGPGSIAEALCCGVPLLISSYLPGQERGNVDFVVANGAGRYVPGIWALTDTVRELAAPGSLTLAHMRDSVRHLARPEATAGIADLIRSRVVAGPVGAP